MQDKKDKARARPKAEIKTKDQDQRPRPKTKDQRPKTKDQRPKIKLKDQDKNQDQVEDHGKTIERQKGHGRVRVGLG
jgi:hypothetical protein